MIAEDLLTAPLADGRVPRRRHGDQRPRRRALRADRGRRGARRRRRAARPLGVARRRSRAAVARGIQRFTGITQAMVDAAPPPEAVLPDLAERARAGACSSPTTRASTRACCARPSTAPALHLARPAGAVHGRARAPLRAAAAPARAGRARRRARRSRSAHAPRAADAETCARVFCALFGGCARTPRRSARRWRCSRAAAARPRAAGRPAAPRPRDAAGPTSPRCPTDPGVYVFRNAAGRALYVGKSVCAAHARALALHAAPASLDRRRPSTSTTSRPSPSSARSCSSTA